VSAHEPIRGWHTAECVDAIFQPEDAPDGWECTGCVRLRGGIEFLDLRAPHEHPDWVNDWDLLPDAL